MLFSLISKAQVSIGYSTLHMCNNTSITLTGTPTGGTWSVSNGRYLSVTSGGVVTSHVVSSNNISSNVTYTVAGVGSATVIVTVDGSAPTISGANTAYIGSTDSFIYSAYGIATGTWSLSDTTIATFTNGSVTALMTLHPVSAGYETLYYTRGNGCYSFKGVVIQHGY